MVVGFVFFLFSPTFEPLPSSEGEMLTLMLPHTKTVVCDGSLGKFFFFFSMSVLAWISARSSHPTSVPVLTNALLIPSIQILAESLSRRAEALIAAKGGQAHVNAQGFGITHVVYVFKSYLLEF